MSNEVTIELVKHWTIFDLNNDSTESDLSSTKMCDGHMEYSLFVMGFRFLISWASEYEIESKRHTLSGEHGPICRSGS